MCSGGGVCVDVTSRVQWRRSVRGGDGSCSSLCRSLIGQKASDPQVQRDAKHFPFRVVASEDDKPLVEVRPAAPVPMLCPLFL